MAAEEGERNLSAPKQYAKTLGADQNSMNIDLANEIMHGKKPPKDRITQLTHDEIRRIKQGLDLRLEKWMAWAEIFRGTEESVFASCQNEVKHTSELINKLFPDL